MVETPEATCVLYCLRNLLRVVSSIIPVVLFEVFIAAGRVGEEDSGACSNCLSIVIPENYPLGAAAKAFLCRL